MFSPFIFVIYCMRFFYSFLLILSAFLPMATPNYGQNCYTEWQVDGNSVMRIEGTTNVNEFVCTSIEYDGGDIMREYCDAQGVHFLEGVVKMSASGFDCQHAVMSKDLRKTLNASEFPEIIIEFNNLEEDLKYPKGTVFTGEVKITLSGVERSYQLTCRVLQDQDQRYLSGSNDFKFTDFGIDPPQKFLGAIRVRNEVSVDFNLRMYNAQIKKRGE